MDIDEILNIFKLLKKDIIIIEGLKELNFPTIICGKDIDDAKELGSGKEIILYSVIMATDDKIKNIDGINVYNALNSFEKIYAKVNKVPG